MTRDEQQAYVRRWSQSGRLLEELRWRELRALSPQAALRASDALIRAALDVPFPAHRVAWSGLVELQKALREHRSR